MGHRLPGGWRAILPAALVILLTATPLVAQAPPFPELGGGQAAAAEEATAERAPSLDERLARVRAEIATATEGGATAGSQALALLRELERTLEELRYASEHAAELAAGLEARDGELATATDEAAAALLPGEPPYDLARLDELLDRSATTTAALEAFATAIEGHADALAVADTRLEELRQRTDAARREATAEEVRLLELQLQLAEERRALEEAKLEGSRREHELLVRQQQVLDAAIERARQHLQPTAADRERLLRELAERAEELRAERIAAENLLRQAETAWRKREAAADAEADPIAAAELAALRQAVETARRRVESIAVRESRLPLLRQAAEHRLDLLAGTIEERSALEAMRDDLEAAQAEVAGERLRQSTAIEQTRAELAALDARLAGSLENGPAQRWMREEREQLQARAELLESELARTQRDLLRIERPLRETTASLSRVDLGERLGALWSGTAAVWRYPLFGEESGAPVTLGSLVLALVLVVLGLIFSRWLAAVLEKRLAPRFKLDPGAAATFRTLTYYLLAVLFILWALWLVNIPLTAFTVLGGALAIGVGFGSQNIVNNFISGLIMMAERPVKVGDLIEIEGTNGTVEQIGPRSTRIRSGDNTHVIVPNSTFLENNILNWTVSDNIIRTSLDVGVAYGSPTRQVAELLREAAGHDERVLASPAPEVLFVEFAADALAFRLFFWIRVRAPLDRIRIQSEVRYRIDEIFREHGITIAFPQRDVHLDVSSPLPVRVIDEPPRAS